MYSGLGSRRREVGRGRLMILGLYCLPSQVCREGRTKSLYVTMALTGLPGNPKNRHDDVVGRVPNVVGFPGFMNTRPKWIVPFSFKIEFFT